MNFVKVVRIQWNYMGKELKENFDFYKISLQFFILGRPNLISNKLKLCLFKRSNNLYCKN